MELEEAINRLKLHKEYAGLQNGTCIVNISDLKIVLQSLENSIPKEVIVNKKTKYQNEMKQDKLQSNMYNANNIRQEVITVLQELLERK